MRKAVLAWVAWAGAVGAAGAAPDAADQAAAMERAQRMAANPMRVILEAAKVRRKAGSDGEPVDAAAVKKVAAHAVAAEPAALARPMTVAAAAPAPAAAAVQAAAPALLTTSTELAASGVLGAAPALPLSDVAVAPGAIDAGAPMPALAIVAAAPVQPRLVAKVDPSFAPRQQEDAMLLREVTADLRLAADGSVADVALVGRVPLGLQRPIVAALQQWRFEPLAGERQHRVQLVFRDAN